MIDAITHRLIIRLLLSGEIIGILHLRYMVYIYITAYSIGSFHFSGDFSFSISIQPSSHAIIYLVLIFTVFIFLSEDFYYLYICI